MGFKVEVNAVMNNVAQNQQQDAQEAITQMFTACGWLSQYVKFHQNVKTQCKACGNDIIVESENMFLILHPSRQHMPLQECINKEYEAEKLVDYACDTCGSRDLMFNVVEITSSPSVIFIQLGQLGNDNNCCISIDPEISVNQHLYQFKSAIWYEGDTGETGETEGHYITYTEVDNIWYKFNDNTVSQVSIDSVKNAAQKFYILCYMKI